MIYEHTSIYFTSSNPILLKGDFGIEVDTGVVKEGDGVTAWNSLAYTDILYEFTTTTGTDTYVASLKMPPILGYFAGMRIRVKFGITNTGAATINVNSLGAKSIVKRVSTALVAGDIIANRIYHLIYDGTNFQIQPYINATTDLSDNVEWTDYTSISTVVGWSSFTSKFIQYKKTGSVLFVQFYLYGTSNSATTNFSIPYTSRAGSNYVDLLIRSQDAGVYSLGALAEIGGSATVVNFYKLSDGTPFTNSGLKGVSGLIIIPL